MPARNAGQLGAGPCRSGAAGGRAVWQGYQGKQAVEQEIGLAGQVDTLREVQPVDDVAIQCAVQQGGGALGIQRLGELTLADGIGQGDLKIPEKVGGLAAHVFAQGDGFAFQRFQIEHDGEHLLMSRIGTDLHQHLLEEAAQLAEGIGLLLGNAGVELVGERLAQLLPQGDEQLFFILEVPVDGATGQVGGPGNIGQAGLGQAV